MVPHDARLSRAETIFRAGQASIARQSSGRALLWPLTTAASLLLSITLAGALVRRPAELIVYVERPVPTTGQPAAEAPVGKATRVRSQTIDDRIWLGAASDPLWRGDRDYLWARQLALRFGVESLPTTGVATGSAADVNSLRYADWRRGLGHNDLTFNDPLPGPPAEPSGAHQETRGGS